MEARPVACERTAQFASLAIDGELSRFERILLARHLRACATCAEQAAAIAAITERLRAAPLEPIPAPIVVTRPHRRAGWFVSSAVAAAAVALVAVWLGISSVGPAQAPGPEIVPGSAGATASGGRNDWAAGLPRSPQLIQLIPGGLYTAGLSF
jgi:anti-sigma factor RsiW